MAKDYIIAGTDSIGRPAVRITLEPVERFQLNSKGEAERQPARIYRAVSLPADAIDTSIYDRPLFFTSKQAAEDYLAKINTADIDWSALQSIHIFPISRCACGSLKVDPAGTDPEPYKCKKCQRKDTKK